MMGVDSGLIEQFGPPTLENLEKAWAVSHLSSSFNYAGVTIMLYDMLLTMQMEVSLAVELIVGCHVLEADMVSPIRFASSGEQRYLSLRLHFLLIDMLHLHSFASTFTVGTSTQT